MQNLCMKCMLYKILLILKKNKPLNVIIIIEPKYDCGQLEKPHCKNCNKNPCSAWRHSDY